MSWLGKKHKNGKETQKNDTEDKKAGEKYIVRLEWERCIGSAVCPAFWKVAGNKTVLKDSVIVDKKNEVYEVSVEEKDLKCNVLAAAGCPPKCISVLDSKGNKIAPK